MITSIRLRHWKSHEDTHVQLGKGTNLFIGSMGAGKTSMVEAISFALFGTFPALKSRRVRIEELIMQRPKKQEKAVVEVDFESQGKKYKVIRSISSKHASEVQLYKEGKLVEAQPVRATEMLEEELEMDYDLFSRIIYGEQNRIDYLLVVPKGERKNQVDDLLGLNRFEKVRANAGTLANKLVSRKAEKESYVKGMDALKWREEMERAEFEAAKISHAISALKQEKEKLAGEVKEIDAELIHLEKAEKAFREKQMQAGRAEAELKTLEQEVKELGDGQKKAQLQAQVKEEEAKAAQLEKKLSLLGDELIRNNAERLELEKSLKGLHEAKADCPVCGSELGHERKEHLKEERETKLKKIKESVEHAESLRRETEKAGRDARNELVKLRTAVERLERIEKLAAKESEVRERLHKINAELTAAKENYSEAKLSDARKRAYEAGKKLAMAQKDIENEEQREREMKGNAAEAKKKLEEITKLQAELSGMQAKIERVHAFQESVVETQAMLREQLVSALNEAMAQLWPSVYPYRNYSQVRLRATEDDYALELEAGGEWQAIENCSGGERSCAALTLRIAFAMVLAPNLSWLILDEPTHNLDSQAVSLLNRALHDELPRIMGQVIVITHEDALKEGASYKVFYFERDKENSDRTVVEELAA